MGKNDFIKLYCFGCGAELQNDDPKLAGYIPKFLEKDAKYLCQRCFRLQHYGINNEDITYNKDYSKIIEQAYYQKALFVYVVDLFAFQSSIVMSLLEKLRGAKLLVIATKRDVIPSAVSDQKLINFVKNELLNLGIKPLEVMLSSGKNNYNIENIVAKANELRKGKNVYIFGAASVGKSSLVNAFFKIYSNQTNKMISTSYYPGTTLDVIKVPLNNNSYIFDTPGISLDSSIYSHIDKKLIKYITPNKEIKPLVFQLQANQSILIENLAKIDFINNEKTNITIFMSNYLTATRSKLENSNNAFNNMIINKQIKHVDRNVKSLDDLLLHEITLPNEACDIVISGLLWIKLKGKGENIRVYTLKGVEVNIRKCKI